MVRADLLLFGYCTVSVCAEDKGAAADTLLKNGISASFNRNGDFIIPYRKREKVQKALGGKIKYSVSQPRGFFAFLIKNRHRYGAFLGIIVFAFLIFLSTDTVWDVRIEGAAEGSEDAVLEELSAAGLSVGKRWSKLDRSRVEINTLAASDSIAWININRRGSVAYVKVSDKKIYQEGEDAQGTANIVAARDCVIEEISVVRGYPMVKKGESVKAGDILISGVIPTELGGGFCYASGVVIGRYDDKIEVFSDNTVIEKIYSSREIKDVSVNIFGKTINIFKRYRQYGENCDIIEEKRDLRLYKRLPIAFSKTVVMSYEEKTQELSAEQIVARCTEALKEKMEVFLIDKEARRMTTQGEFLPDGYKMVCNMTVSSAVGKIQEFEVE